MVAPHAATSADWETPDRLDAHGWKVLSNSDDLPRRSFRRRPVLVTGKCGGYRPSGPLTHVFAVGAYAT